MRDAPISNFNYRNTTLRCNIEPTKNKRLPVLQSHLSRQTQLFNCRRWCPAQRKQKQRVGCGLARVWCQETPAWVVL